MALTIEELLKKLEKEKKEKMEKEQTIFEQREKLRKEYLKINKMLFENISISNTSVSSSAGGKVESRKQSIPSITTISYNVNFDATVDVTAKVTSDGNLSLTEVGICYSLSETPTINDDKLSTVDAGLSPSIPSVGDEFTETLTLNDYIFETVYARAYAINSIGVGYGEQVSFSPEICLVEGTMINLYNGETKRIEDVNYDDDLLVWNFDKGIFDSAKPLWIKKPETSNNFNLLKFSDGTSLKMINQHRIFNKDAGKFTPGMMNITPIGTTTFNSQGEEITLVHKEIIKNNVKYYNIITDKHINLFSDGILTSCRYNNIYPISNMKFIKDNRKLINPDCYNVPIKYFKGLRLEEQKGSSYEIESYINRLINNECNILRSSRSNVII